MQTVGEFVREFLEDTGLEEYLSVQDLVGCLRDKGITDAVIRDAVWGDETKTASRDAVEDALIDCLIELTDIDPSTIRDWIYRGNVWGIYQ